MRKLLTAGLALLLIPALALAGKTVTEGNNTLKIKAAFDPAKASKSKSNLRSTEVSYDYVAGSTNDKRLPDVRSVSAFLGGARFGFGAFPKCDETDAANQSDSVCPNGSKVGEGTAIAEVHPPDDPQARNDLEVDVTVYNGRLDTAPDGSPSGKNRPGLLIYTEIAGANVALPFWAERRNRQVTLYNPEDDPTPNEDALYAIKEIHLVFDRRSVRRAGQRIPFVALPRRCDDFWTVTTTNEPYQGQPITATHRVRCTDA